LVVAVCVVLIYGTAQAAAVIHHNLDARLDPAAHAIAVRDRVTFPATTARGIELLLHPGLSPRVEEPGATLTPIDGGRRASSGESGFAARYLMTLPPGVDTVTLVYNGAIDHPLEQVGEEYDRGQKETRGTISDGGVFLSGASLWYPQLEAP